MMEMSSIIDASLALMGAVAVVAAGMWTLWSHSTPMSTVELQRDAEAPVQELHKAA